MKEFEKPLCYDECCYEGNLPLTWGNISGWEMANRFWMAVCQGAYATHGEVFLSDDEVLWWAKGGVLKGESPKRIAYLKEIVDAIPGASSRGRNIMILIFRHTWKNIIWRAWKNYRIVP